VRLSVEIAEWTAAFVGFVVAGLWAPWNSTVPDALFAVAASLAVGAAASVALRRVSPEPPNDLAVGPIPLVLGLAVGCGCALALAAVRLSPAWLPLGGGIYAAGVVYLATERALARRTRSS
jgi:hypothetical protein